MYYELTDHFVVAASPERTWEFFSSADNLPKITPPWLRFTITTPRPITIEADARLDYTIRWAGVPIRWRTRIVDWEPPTSAAGFKGRFTDLQVRGPYALWHHTHTFAPVADGVECTDKVIYRVPGPGVGRVVHALMVKRQLLEIFRFRREVIGRELGWVRAVQNEVRIRPLP
jgi:ligand-binding SRPBCC domain-containing protein